jgi:hypothetical protein
MKQEIVNGKYRLKFENGFILDGEVVDSSEHGVIFKTKQKTSFINWCQIAELTPREVL